ncbi:exodeoxyribonuclease VII large subunit [Pasteurella atlantica]|uniref:Exodeoxyribonuclease VII large subunit n=2 Tax=Pasteurellaceae TaxID=712 RepID=A0ACC6HKV3_9PAST|nr:exodeoxyribonuclease VII large subunit [Pasteurella atlantica]MDP8051428.1 exodeoxyribonuclease VII large subunit [Pasteurella atlantica]MDP8104692.1 exodeoxyribonuclease VII large subunit [Pasteurella atlantica]MDP8148086.1 exodeoxyribonuclease VII large subunit [Pasteurella atlantica]
MSNILTVTQLNYTVRNLLEMELGHIWLTGEISNFSQPVSGHWYLTLKDDKAQVRSAMFRMKNRSVNFQPQNGMQVLVCAKISLYEPRGDYQLIIESMQMAGDGLLQQQFEQLKIKLSEAGLFSQQYKKAIPSFVKTVGIVTSSTGAALQDILNVLQRRDPSLNIIIYPTLVQGSEAKRDIVTSINVANSRKECDVLIVGRGGGSLEDLWCFNEEEVAYAIFNSNIPIISAVGHEIDVTITDFVADLRAPTPSAAAELVSRDQQDLLRQLQQYYDRSNFAFDRLWGSKITQLEQLQKRLSFQHPMRQVDYQKTQLEQQKTLLLKAFQQVVKTKKQSIVQLNQRVELNPLSSYLMKQQQKQDYLTQRLNYAIEKKFTQKQQLFQQYCTQLDSLSPLKVLSRGYSVTRNENNEVITSIKQIKMGDQIKTKVLKGELISEVIKINH